MKQSKERVLSPIYLDLRKRRSKPFRTPLNEPFVCWIDGHAIPVTSLGLNMSQPSELVESWTDDDFSAVVQAPTSWELEGEIFELEAACLSLLDTWFHTRKECNVEFVDTNASYMKRFKSKGIVTTLTQSSDVFDCHFTIRGTAELVNTVHHTDIVTDREWNIDG